MRWGIVDILRDGVVQAQLPLFREQQNAYSGQLLGERTDVETSCGRVGNMPFETGKAIAVRGDHLAVASDEDVSYKVFEE